MAEFAWVSASPLSNVLVAGRHGAAHAEPGVRLEERRDLSLVQVMARRGTWAAAAQAAERLFGAAPPARPAAVFLRDATLVWSGPDQFLILGAGNGLDDPLAPYREAFEGAASLSDQSDGRTLIRVSGVKSRDALAKVSSLDLHPSAFPVGAAAASSMDHTNVTLWRVADRAEGVPVFDLLVFRSFAESLWHGLETASAEFGIEAASSEHA